MACSSLTRCTARSPAGLTVADPSCLAMRVPQPTIATPTGYRSPAARTAEQPSLGLVVWVPARLTADEVAAIVGVRAASGQRGGRGDSEGYEIKGFPKTTLLLQAVGPVKQVAAELYGPARMWRSLTPYLPVRHPKRGSLDDYLAADVRKELAYRGKAPDVAVARISPQESLSDRWALEFRRYRADERLHQARRGLGLRLTFAEEMSGPLLLGQLSHFGYGIFVPDQEAAP